MIASVFILTSLLKCVLSLTKSYSSNIHPPFVELQCAENEFMHIDKAVKPLEVGNYFAAVMSVGIACAFGGCREAVFTKMFQDKCNFKNKCKFNADFAGLTSFGGDELKIDYHCAPQKLDVYYTKIYEITTKQKKNCNAKQHKVKHK